MNKEDLPSKVHCPSLETMNDLLDFQGGKCARCNQTFSEFGGDPKNALTLISEECLSFTGGLVCKACIPYFRKLLGISS
jgi:hypothetical protein